MDTMCSRAQGRGGPLKARELRQQGRLLVRMDHIQGQAAILGPSHQATGQPKAFGHEVVLKNLGRFQAAVINLFVKKEKGEVKLGGCSVVYLATSLSGPYGRPPLKERKQTKELERT